MRRRAKNMFALGLLSWLYHRPTDGTINFLTTKFASKPDIRDANITAFKAGYAFGETTEVFAVTYEVAPAPMPPGQYRQISGNLALAYGLITAARKAGLPLFLGAYPITPASDVLHELSKHKRFGVTTFQAEDEIAGVGAALGASFAGHLGVTTTSGPGVVAQVGDDRAGRCNRAAVDHLRHPARRAEHRHADQDRAGRPAAGDVRPQWRGAGAGARSAVPGGLLHHRPRGRTVGDQIPDSGGDLVRRLHRQWCRAVARSRTSNAIPPIDPQFASAANATDKAGEPVFLPYLRDPETLARPWAIPGRAGLQHRIGGIEKAKDTGAVSYDPANHEEMVRTRQAKIDGIVRDIPDSTVDDPADSDGRARAGLGAWLGFHVRADRRRCSSRAQDRPPDRLHTPPAPEPVPGQSRSHPAQLRPRRSFPEMNTRPAGHAAAGEVPRGRAQLFSSSRGCRSRSANSLVILKRRSINWKGRTRDRRRSATFGA